MNGIALAAVPAVLVAGSLSVLLSRPLVVRLSSRTGERADPREAAAWTGLLVCGLALGCALVAWREPVSVLFGRASSHRWGFLMDALAGPFLVSGIAAFGLAAGSGLLPEERDRHACSLLLGLAAVSSLLVLAQNLWFLAILVELSVLVGSALVHKSCSPESRGRAAGRYLAVSQVGAGLVVLVLWRLSVLVKAQAAWGFQLSAASLEDLRPVIAFAAPGVLHLLLSLLVVGFLAWAGAACIPFAMSGSTSRLSTGTRTGLWGGLFAGQCCVLLRLWLHVFPFDLWQRWSLASFGPLLALAILGAGVVLWAGPWLSGPVVRIGWFALVYPALVVVGLVLANAKAVPVLVALMPVLVGARAVLALSAFEGPSHLAARSPLPAFTAGCASCFAHAGIAAGLGIVAKVAGSYLLVPLASVFLVFGVWWGRLSVREWPRRQVLRSSLVLVAAVLALVWLFPLASNPAREALDRCLRLDRTYLSLPPVVPPWTGQGVRGR